MWVFRPALFLVVLLVVALLTEAAPQRRFNRFGGRRRNFNRRRFQNNVNRFINNRPNNFNNFFNNRPNNFQGSSQANANVINAQQGNSQISSANANVNSQSSGCCGITGGVAVASNFNINTPFGQFNTANTNAQTVNQGFNFGNRRFQGK